MKKVCCPNGHYYDADKFSNCPICQPSSPKIKIPVQELGPAENPSATPNFPTDLSLQDTNRETPATTGSVVMCTNGHVFNPERSIHCPICGALAKNSSDPPQERKKTICPNGHIYDGKRFSACPICELPTPNASTSLMKSNNSLVQPEAKPDSSDNTPLREELSTVLTTDQPNSSAEAPVSQTQSSGEKLGISENTLILPDVPTTCSRGAKSPSFAYPTDPQTNAPAPSTKPLPPKSELLPIGWLIGFKGVYRGIIFCCYSGRNSLGRSHKADIDLSLDPSIEDEVQAFVIYEPRQRQFFLQAGTGKGLVYRNDTLVFSHDPLEAYDHIQIGNSDFVFVPLCGPHFSWEEE